MTQRVHGVAVFLIYAAVREPKKMPKFAEKARRL
jgi:hypothetical protein